MRKWKKNSIYRMRYYTKRSKILFIKLIYSLLLGFLLTGCKTTKPLSSKIKLVQPMNFSDNILRWRINNSKYKDSIINNSLTINQVKERYKLVEGALYDIQNKEVVSNISLVLHLNHSNHLLDVNMLLGLPVGFFCDASNGVMCRMDIHYDETGNIDGHFSVNNYDTIFRKGKGIWKDYYVEDLLKEEGKVKNNFKFGKWKYYNKNGEIDSIKTYTLQDSVDVRFPHCIFNKNEPCY